MPKKRCEIPKYLDALTNPLIGVSDIKNKVGNNIPPNIEKITFDIKILSTNLSSLYFYWFVSEFLDNLFVNDHVKLFTSGWF
jgi:hypothetical protein